MPPPARTNAGSIDWNGADQNAAHCPYASGHAGGVTPLPLGEAGLSAATLAELLAQRDGCVARGDYRTAAEIHGLHAALAPRGRQLHPADFAPATLDEQVGCFHEHGVCVFPDLLEGAELAAVQAAWVAAEAPAREAWVAQGGAANARTTQGRDVSQTYGFGVDLAEPARLSFCCAPLYS